MHDDGANIGWDAFFGRHRGAATPFLHLPDGATVSHAAFLDRAGRFAAALAVLGVAPGDRVATQVAKSPDALALYAACLQTGAVFLPLNTGYTANEVAYFLSDCDAALLVCAPGAEAALAPVAAEAGTRLMTLDGAGAGSLAEFAARQTPRTKAAPRGAGHLAALLYTSGTTGRSKGAMLTHGNLVSNAEALVAAWRFGPSDVLLHALPLFHTHGLFVATNVTLLAGGSMILMPRFDEDAVFAALPRATAMMGVPTYYTRLLADPRLTREAVAHVRLFVSGSAPLLPETHRRFAEVTGHAILERYGMTETSMNTSNPYAGERRAGTVGFALPGVEVVVADPDTGALLPAGTVGQVEVRGPNVFAGYWRMPDKTAAEFRANGFFQTGDLGRFDADGYLTIVGRSKDLIISGGYNIYPKEIELLLDAQPGVVESAVIGVPHADLGEAPLALVVAERGAAVDPAALLQAIAGSLARYKQPRAIEVVADLPRNAMGKVQKAELRKTWAKTFA